MNKNYKYFNKMMILCDLYFFSFLQFNQSTCLSYEWNDKVTEKNKKNRSKDRKKNLYKLLTLIISNYGLIFCINFKYEGRAFLNHFLQIDNFC